MMMGPRAVSHCVRVVLSCRLRRRRHPDEASVKRWDAAIEAADAEYAHHMHLMLCGHDCHSHTARVLNHVRYLGASSRAILLLP